MASEMNEELGYDAEDIEDFGEYDDDDEAFEAAEYDDDDEAFEAFEYDDDDETLEALEAAEYDDDDEAFEYDEALEVAAEYDDDDEALEAAEYDDDDEALEAAEYDDDDEAAEAEYGGLFGGEADAAERRSRRAAGRRAARARALRAARRRAALRRRAARAKQRAAVKRAKGARRALSRRLRKIRGPRRVPIRRISTLRGKGIVTARLPNGRTTKMMITPPLASQGAVNRLTRQITANDAKQARAIRAQGKTIARLKSAQSAAVKSLTAQQLKSGRDLSKRITTGDAKLDKRISKEAAAQKTALSKHRAQMVGALRRQQQRAMWNSILLASSLPLYAAYGERENPFAKKNLILTGSLAFWLLGDDLVGRFLGKDGKRGKAWRSGANAWSYLAPIGNAATAWFLLDDGQHERFVTGVVDVPPVVDGKTVELTMIGSDYRKAFNQITDPPALATIESTSLTRVTTRLTLEEEGEITRGPTESTEVEASEVTVTAEVVADGASEDKKLRLRLSLPPVDNDRPTAANSQGREQVYVGTAKVAWAVDTKKRD